MLVVLTSVFVAALALLLVPIRISFDAVPEQRPTVHCRIAWLFGLVRCGLTGGRPRKASDTAKRRSTSAEARARATAFLRASGVVARLRKLLRDVVASARPEVEWLRVELGLVDPADTGRAWAILAPVSGWLMYRYAGSISLEPNFVEPTFVVEGHAQLTVIPLQTLAVLVGFLGSPSVLRGLYGAFRS